ncbi:ABC transporter permease [Bacillus sp. FJAT-42315]|uniref:ABC transporter permease n=1 Tax=Bacillus sp. FJAT-42315 TaxID=2014077 RepID=UPI000C25173D|nr:ABC transporter permease [Bacillus sp. FJAT-42315]
MLQLIKLEMKKFKFGWYVKGAVIANIIMTVLMCCIMYIEQEERDLMITMYQDVFVLIGGMVRATFIVFAAVLIAKMVIEEYRNKTILILFSYPVSRKKIIASKLLVIAVMTFVTILLSNMIVAGSFFIINMYVPIVPFSVTVHQFLEEAINMLFFAIAAAGASLIPLYFGMRKYSVAATIASSLIVVAIAFSSNSAFSMVTFIPLQLGLAAIGMMIAYSAIRNIEREDTI